MEASVACSTFVRSSATRLGMHARTFARISSDRPAQLTKVSRSSRSHAPTRAKSGSESSLESAAKLSRFTNKGYVNVSVLESARDTTWISLKSDGSLVKLGLCQSSSTAHSHHVLDTRTAE